MTPHTSVTTSDICTRVTEDSDESDNGEILPERIEEFRHVYSEEIADVTDMVIRCFETFRGG